MRRRLLAFVTVSAGVALGACASAGTPDNRPRVPVYTTEQAPCEYEVIEAVRATSGRMPNSIEQYLEEAERALGPEGAEVEGADAVVIESPQAGTARRREVGRPGSAPSPPSFITFRGQAVRFTGPGCG